MTEINYDDMAEAPVAVTDDEVKSIAELADRQIILEDFIVKTEDILKQANENLAKLTGELLPDAMRSAGVKEFTLSNGCELNLNSKIRANITEENVEFCHTWLRDNGSGEILRNKFEASFGKDDDEAAQALATHLIETDVDFSQKESIPWNTLDAFVRNKIAESDPGEDWEKAFGVYRQTSVKIVRPKT